MAQTQITLTDGIPNWAAPDSDNYYILGNALANRITTSSGDDIIDGGAGNDTIDSGTSTDVIYGGAGDDLITAGQDQLYWQLGITTAYGGDGNDSFKFTGAQATLDGGNGDDDFLVMGENARIYGGAGRDHATIQSDALAYMGADDDTVDFVESTFDLTATAYGEAGNDTFNFNPDSHWDAGSTFVAYGGTGNDTYRFVGSSNPMRVAIHEAAGEGTDTVEVLLGADYTLGDNLENIKVSSQVIDGIFYNSPTTGSHLAGNALSNVISGSTRADTVWGNEGNDTVYGGSGADWVSGGGGNDYLSGDAGADTLYGDAGNDTLIGGAGQDFVSYANGAAGITLALDSLWDAATSTWYGLAAGDALAAGDRLISVEMVNGTNYADTLTAGKGATYLGGGAGADVLTGLTGADTLYGGDGGDQVSGGAGNDWLYGGSGDDTINAGAGNDYMTGDQGADVFVFTAAGFVAGEVDRIAAFDAAYDSIRVEGAALKSILSTAGANGVELHMALAAGGEFVLQFDGGLTSAEVLSHITWF